MPLWFILSFKNSAFNNSLEATDYFYKTGLFADIDPAFVFIPKLNCANDPQFNDLWGLQKGAGIDVCHAWTIATAEGAGVKVAIVDHGIDRTHNDLKANLHDSSYDAKSQTSPSVFTPGLSHGTHVMGIVAGVKDNNLQIVGVAPQAKILEVSHTLPVANNTASYDTLSAQLASGISWAVQQGADIINCSWGIGFDCSSAIHSLILEDAIISAIRNGRNGKGVIAVFSAGNDGGNSGQQYADIIGYPACFNDSILCVGAIDIDGRRSSFGNFKYSGYGEKLDVVAPGSNILSTIENNGIDYKSGTSMAAPHVAGIASLLLSMDSNLTGQQVRDIIEQTAMKIRTDLYTYDTVPNRQNGTWHEETGYGVASAFAAVYFAKYGVLPPLTDFLIRDEEYDVGAEPNNGIISGIDNSPDIWIRNIDDNGLIHENPVSKDMVFVYVRVKNIGYQTSIGNEKLCLYWAKRGTSLAWDSCWNGKRFPNNGPLMGNFIDSVSIPSLKQGEDTIVKISWYTPDTADYSSIVGDARTFSLLARIVSANDTMTFREVVNIDTNIIYNNNIACKNIDFDNTRLAIRDDIADVGKTPNLSGIIWESPDIWIRQNDDKGSEHQTPLPQRKAWINVRVHNFGNIASKEMEFFLYIYWLKAGFPSPWQDCLSGLGHFIPGNTSTPLAGGNINRIPLPPILPGNDTVITISWDNNVPNPADYKGICGEPCAFHILANIEPIYNLEIDTTTCIDSFMLNNHNVAGKNINIGKTVLTIRDDINDTTGSKPNSYMGNLYESPDIWTRWQQDFDLTNQPPQPNFLNWIHVRVTNIGALPSQGKEVLKLYYAKKGTNLAWDSCWSGNTFANNALLGDFIDSVVIPPLLYGADTILTIPWTTPDYRDYCSIMHTDSVYGFYLLARIESKYDTIFETKSIDSLVQWNYNIAMKQVELIRRDLLIRDTLTDIGTEPTTCEIISESPDIWTKNPIGGMAYVPKSNQPTEVYVRITNTGCTASQGNEVLKLYWRKTEKDISWNSYWQGGRRGGILLGDTIRSVTIPPIQPNGVHTLTIPWKVPDVTDYETFDDSLTFSLLARIEENNPFLLLESEDIEQNVRNNRGIALKNVQICKSLLVVRDNEADDGKKPIPYTENPWNSPDIWINDPNRLQYIKPKGKGDDRIYLKITEMGDCLCDIEDGATVSLFWAKSGQDITKNDLNFIGSASFASGEAACKIDWSSLSKPTTKGEYYLLAVIDEKDRPTTFPNSHIEDFILERNNMAGKAVYVGEKFDLMVRDCPLDTGGEKNTISKLFYVSEDIWVERRLMNPPSGKHENPKGFSTNWVYVKITNRGDIPSTGTASERLFLYWSKAGTDLPWDLAWNGKSTFVGGAVVGAPIDSVTIPKILPGDSAVLAIRWDAPNYTDYDGIRDPHHFCLLARIVAPTTDPMTYPEILYNAIIENNNNIAMKNVSILDIGNGYDSQDSPGAAIFVANWATVAQTYCIKFYPVATTPQTLVQEAEVTVKLGDNLFNIWQRSGSLTNNDIVYNGDNTFLITGVNASLCNLIFYPEEMGLLSVKFNFLTRKKKPNFEYNFHVIQTMYEGAEEVVIGGELYNVITPPRTPFYAEANDVYAFKDEPITLTAADIGEEAIYRWYDAEDNLVYEGQSFSLTAAEYFSITAEGSTYKLEVIALADGYKDYATAMVKIVPGKIEELFPNPASDELTVVCVVNNTTGNIPTNSTIQITNSVGMVFNTFPIIESPQETVIDVSAYPIGAYKVTLFCNGIVADTKTFVKY